MRKAQEELLWRIMLWVCRKWATHHMDQWTKVRLRTPYGLVYLSLKWEDPHPESYDDYPGPGL